MTKTTKAELVTKVAELEVENSALAATLALRTRQLEEAEATLRERETELEATQALVHEWAAYAANTAAQDALVQFVAALPRKTLYRALARALHPDMGGDVEAMQALTAAWSASVRS
jgi:hypothetical protein